MPGDGASLASFASFFGGGSASDLARVGVRRIVVRTQFTPPITIEEPLVMGPDGAPVPASGSFSLGALIRPEITIEGDLGTFGPFAPYGQPTDNYLPYLVGAGVGGVALVSLLWGAAKLAKYGAVIGGGIFAAGWLRNQVARRAT